MLTNSKKVWVWSGNRPSNGAKELAAQSGFLRLRPDRIFKVKPDQAVVNWGSTQYLPFEGRILNKPSNVQLATDKLQAFYAMEGQVPIPEFTEDISEMFGWCVKGFTVVVRNKLTGHSGDGIVILEKNTITSLADAMKYKAPLFTKYVFKVKEFRVHVVGNKVVDTQQKIKDPDREVKTWKVRSHDNGFIFVRNNVTADGERDVVARAAIKALGLDFGAVDIIQDKLGNYYVLEVNTAPGLEGQTVTSYAKGIGAYLGA